VGCNNINSAVVSLPLAPTDPGIFSLARSGAGQGSVLNLDGSVNGIANPAIRGSIISIYVTGFGLFNAPGSDGLSRLALPVTALFGSVQATVVYAGDAPGLTLGLQQINILIPTNGPVGSAVPVSLSVGGVSTQAGITLAIQ
jgi:uncharacterized protein (TIGR03437 family)